MDPPGGLGRSYAYSHPQVDRIWIIQGIICILIYVYIYIMVHYNRSDSIYSRRAVASRGASSARVFLWALAMGPLWLGLFYRPLLSIWYIVSMYWRFRFLNPEVCKYLQSICPGLKRVSHIMAFGLYVSTIEVLGELGHPRNPAFNVCLCTRNR